MKKRMLSLLLAVALLWAVLPRCILTAHAEEEPRKLLEVWYYWGDDAPQVTHLHYNEATGLLERISFTGGDYKIADYLYSYDDNGRLTQVTSGSKEADYYSYVNLQLHYDSQGRLKTWDDFSMFHGDIRGECVYGDNGRLIRTAAQYDYPVDCFYFYDANGRTAEVERSYLSFENPSTTMTSFSYDAQGRVSRRVDTNGNNRKIADYTYDCTGFAMEEKDGSLIFRYDAGLLPAVDPYLEAMLWEWAFSPLTFLADSDARLTRENGYLLSITDSVNQGTTEVRTEFVYEAGTMVEETASATEPVTAKTQPPAPGTEPETGLSETPQTEPGKSTVSAGSDTGANPLIWMLGTAVIAAGAYFLGKKKK